MTQTAVGTTALFEQPCGDRYNGEVAEWHGDVVTLRNYSAWYQGDTSPYDSPYADDTVSLRVTSETRVEIFG